MHDSQKQADPAIIQLLVGLRTGPEEPGGGTNGPRAYRVWYSRDGAYKTQAGDITTGIPAWHQHCQRLT